MRYNTRTDSLVLTEHKHIMWIEWRSDMKKLLSVLLAAAMCLAFAACGGGSIA
jgi:hypothetical protein